MRIQVQYLKNSRKYVIQLWISHTQMSYNFIVVYYVNLQTNYKKIHFIYFFSTISQRNGFQYLQINKLN